MADIEEGNQLAEEFDAMTPKLAPSNEVELPEQMEEIEVFNGIPNFPAGYKFGDKFVIEERVGWDDRVGATYFVTPQKSERPLELVLRVDNLLRHNPSLLHLEIAVLRKANEHHKHKFFAHLHEQGRYETDYFWYTTYFKEGPSLRQISDFMVKSRGQTKFSDSTVGRFAFNLFEIAGFLHSIDFLFCALDQTIFGLSAAGRTLFLNDLSAVRQRPKEGAKSESRWTGNLLYTPLAWSEQSETPFPGHLKGNLELEGIFYMILELALGKLPWDSIHTDEVVQQKANFYENPRDILGKIHKSYTDLWQEIIAITLSEKPYTSIDNILGFCEKIYMDAGGCKDWDEDFDFERQPKPEELPRFVMEKVPVEEDNQGEQQEEIKEE